MMGNIRHNKSHPHPPHVLARLRDRVQSTPGMTPVRGLEEMDIVLRILQSQPTRRTIDKVQVQ